MLDCDIIVSKFKFHLWYYIPFLDWEMYELHYTPINELNLLLLSFFDRLIGLVDRVFTNGPGDQGSIPGRVVPKTFKMVLDTSLLNTQQYKVGIKGKVE